MANDDEDIRRLESELERHKEELHEDAAQLSAKVQETRAELSPNNLARNKVLLLSGIAFALGFLLGWRSYRAVPVIKIGDTRVPSGLKPTGKPVEVRVLRP
jgi:hypothetical protein